jgi:CheY-like chemotaxis protein
MTADEFTSLVRQSRLVDDVNLNALLFSLEQRTSPAESEAATIARLLVQGKLLSAWQADRLLSGHSDGFFLGRYKLLSALGGGSMGIVYLAEHVRMRRRAALKILPTHFVEDPKRLELFYRESEATAALDHPNVVRAYDVDNEGETYYLVMEYVDGVNLNQLVARDGPLPCGIAAEYMRQAADGLAHAHERGIIHCDVKPANLMLDASGRIKILDMGLSHWEEVEASPRRGALQISGTPSFLAPEVGLGHAKVEAASDIYSLGCTFYFLLTGQPPFSGDTLSEILQRHAHDAPPRPSAHDAGVPAELEEIYLQMMAKRPRDRLAGALQVRDALQNWQTIAAAAQRDPAARPSGGMGGERCLVLVAEDDEVTRQMLVLQLEKAGFEVWAAADGREAMDRLDARVSVCLFDLNMPAANGMDCLRYVQRTHPETPVIILTASGEIQDAIAAMRDGAFDYLTKPCRIANVLARLEEAVRARLRSAEDGASLNALLTAPATEASTISETVVDHRLQRDVT